MANTILRVGTIARAGIGLLIRELVVARTVWADAIGGDEFVGALDDTVTVRVPAIGQPARTRTLRAGTAIVNDDISEFGVAVKLTTDVYKGVSITDEDLTLSITDFGSQILRPQTQAVAEGVEDELITAIEGADYVGAALTISAADPFLAFVDAATALNDNFVPRNGRTMLVGSAVEAAVLKSDRLKSFPMGAGKDALEDASLGRMAGFRVIGSAGIGAYTAYAYHRSAFILATRAPKIPDGASMGEGISEAGIAMRWLKDYDYDNTTDRSLVNTWVGAVAVEDAVDPTDPASATDMLRAVELEMAGGS